MSMRYEPLRLPFDIKEINEETALALNRNFAAIEQAMSRIQVYENNYGIPVNLDGGTLAGTALIVRYGEKKVFSQQIEPTIGSGVDEALEFDLWLYDDLGTPVWKQLRKGSGGLEWVVVANRSTHPAEYDIITTVGLDAAVITTGLLAANRIEVGSGTSFDTGYDPSNKRRVFTDVPPLTPSPPYDIGDLWAQGVGNYMMVCVLAKASGGAYHVDDWGVSGHQGLSSYSMELGSDYRAFKYDGDSVGVGHTEIVITAQTVNIIDPTYEWYDGPDLMVGEITSSITIARGAYALGTEQYSCIVDGEVDGSPVQLTDYMTILRVKDGTVGAAGTGLNFRGQWGIAEDYVEGDYVFDESSTDPLADSMYICILAILGDPGNDPPKDDATSWVEFYVPYGEDGTDAKGLRLLSSAMSFRYGDDDQIVEPANITLVAWAQNLDPATTYTWTCTATLTGSGNTRTLSKANFDAAGLQGLDIKVERDGLEDIITIWKLMDASGYTVIGTNESHTFPASPEGELHTVRGSDCELKVFKGTTQFTYKAGAILTDFEYEVTDVTVGGDLSVDSEIIGNQYFLQPVSWGDFGWLLFTFDQTLLSHDGSQSFDYTRESEAYNSRGEYCPTNIPIYSSIDDSTIDSAYVTLTIDAKYRDQTTTIKKVISYTRSRSSHQAYSAVLTNEFVNLVANREGVIPSYDNAYTYFIAWKGNERITSQCTIEVNSVSDPSITYTYAWSSSEGWGLYITGMGTDLLEGAIDLYIKYQGDVVAQKIFRFTKQINNMGRALFVGFPFTPYRVDDVWLDNSNNVWRCTIARATGDYSAGDWTAAGVAEQLFTGSSDPSPPYEKGDFWHRTIGALFEVWVCIVDRPSGSYTAGDWIRVDHRNLTKTVIDGGLVTTGTIELKGAGGDTLVGMTGALSGSSAVRMWAGSAFASRSTAPFRVTQGGSLVSTAGYIAGWEITTTGLKLGTSTNTRGIDTGDVAFYAGHATPASAPFRVTRAGVLTATAGVLGGLTIGSPTTAGLWISTTHLGYFDGGAWKTYMDNTGKFYLGGTSGSLQWNGSTLTITGSGTFTGIITANTGYIGGASGWIIASGRMYSNDIELKVGVGTAGYIRNTSNRWLLYNDGSGQLASGNISWTSAGVLTLAGGLLGGVNRVTIDSSGLNVGTSGMVRGGATSYTSGAGFWMGYYGGAYCFRIGNTSGAGSITWNGATLTIRGNLNASDIVAGSMSGSYITAGTLHANKIQAGTITATEISSYTITATKMNISSLSSISANIGTITSGSIYSVYVDGVYGNFNYLTAGSTHYTYIASDGIRMYLSGVLRVYTTYDRINFYTSWGGHSGAVIGDYGGNQCMTVSSSVDARLIRESGSDSSGFRASSGFALMHAQSYYSYCQINVSTGSITLSGTGTMYIHGSAFYSNSIRDTWSSSGSSVVINASSGQVYRLSSSIKYKMDVEDLEFGYAEEFLLKGRPVWFRSKGVVDRKDWSYYGYIAEELAQVDPRLVSFYKDPDSKEDGPGEPVGVEVDKIVALLHVNLKAHQKRIEELERRME